MKYGMDIYDRSPLIKAEHVMIENREDEIDLGETTLVVVLTDAIMNTGLWPAFAIYKNGHYKRGPQQVIADHMPKHSVFGVREYIPIHEDEVDPNQTTLHLNYSRFVK